MDAAIVGSTLIASWAVPVPPPTPLPDAFPAPEVPPVPAGVVLPQSGASAGQDGPGSATGADAWHVKPCGQSAVTTQVVAVSARARDGSPAAPDANIRARSVVLIDMRYLS